MSDRVIEGKDLAKVTADAVTHFLGFKENGVPVQVEANSMLDNVFIAYHRKSDGLPAMVRPCKWNSLQNNGEIADGVAIVSGGRILIVAPTEADQDGLLWSSGLMQGSTTALPTVKAAVRDMDGENNTAVIISKSTQEAITNTEIYAPGFCNLYSRVNSSGHGLTTGKWWLPSLGEMMNIYSCLDAVNGCLSLISGATKISEATYWTSSENGKTYAWYFNFGYAITTGRSKTNKLRVRPVSTFGE